VPLPARDDDCEATNGTLRQPLNARSISPCSSASLSMAPAACRASSSRPQTRQRED